MTRTEAHEHIAALMNEWFKANVDGEPYTADYIADQLAEIAEDDAHYDESVMFYPVFAMEILTRSGAVD